MADNAPDSDTGAEALSSRLWSDDGWQGIKIGRYQLDALLGDGAMGRVFLATDTILQRQVALKVIPERIDEAAASGHLTQFLREAQVVARLEHPNIVCVYDIVHQEGVVAVAMEYVQGGTLAERISAKGTLAPAEACRIVAEAAEGLGAAHREGIIHRDIKPANLILTEKLECKVVDFGATHVAKAEEVEMMKRKIVGTPYFAAPEVIRGHPPQPESDIYSLGIVLWWALTGGPPFRGTTRKEVYRKHLDEPLPDMAAACPGISPAIERVIERCLEKDPAGRIPSCAELAALLRSASGETAANPEIARITAAVAGDDRQAKKATTRKTVSPARQKQAPPPAKNRKRLVSAGIIAGVVLLLGAVILAMILSGNGKDSDAQQGTPGLGDDIIVEDTGPEEYYEPVENDTTGNTTAESDITPGDMPPIVAEAGVVSGVGNSAWTTVRLRYRYTSMIVICTPVYDASSDPLVIRVTNAAGSSFDLRSQRTDSGMWELDDVSVHYFVIEEGVYTKEKHGSTIEAAQFTSTRVDCKGSYIGSKRSYRNRFDRPVVLGQVLSYNDERFSTFWAKGSGEKENPPDADALFVGKQVGEDPIPTRDNETIGYIVVESGIGRVGDMDYLAGVGGQNIYGIKGKLNKKGSGKGKGKDRNIPALPAGANEYRISGLRSVSAAILSYAGMAGDDGGWPVLLGGNALDTSRIRIVVDEDTLLDTERTHKEERIAYMVFGTARGGDTGGTDANADEKFTVTPGAKLVYDAATDKTPGNWIWENTAGLIAYDWALAPSVSYTSNPRAAPPGIRAAYVFTGNGGGTTKSLGDLPDKPQEQSATWELWFSPDDDADADILFETGGNVHGMSIVYDGKKGETIFTLDADTTQARIAGGAGAITRGAFNQLVAVYEKHAGGPDADALRLFVNGRLSAEKTAVEGIDKWAGTNPGGLGTVADSAGEGVGLTPTDFEGKIALLRFYATALDQRQIGDNYRAVAGREP